MNRRRQVSCRSGVHRLILVAFPLALLIVWLFPQDVSAHAILLRSDPAKDSMLSTSPSHIQMWFSEDLNPTFSTAYVVNAAKSAANVQEDVKTHVDKGDAHVSTTDSREMDVSLKPNLPSAVYVVLYRTQSAEDGHILYGSFLFIVEAANGALPTFNGRLPQQGAFSGSGNPNGQLDGPTLFSFIMISLVDLGAVFWVGAQLWRIFVISELQSEDQQVIVHQMEQRLDRHFSWSVLLLILLANIGVLVGQALTLTSGQWGPALAPTLLVSLIARGQFGAYHCTCQGADAYVGPRWRFVGDHIEAGMAAGRDVSQRTLLNLAQNSEEKAQDWHEVILIDDRATPDQVQALLQVFERSQGSEIAHPHRLPSAQRPAYLVPMRYTIIEGRPTLSVTFSQNRSRLVQGNASMPFFKEWTYNGPVAVQQPLEQWS